MKKEDIDTEISALLYFINESRDQVALEHDKFQVALTNTLRLLDESSSTLIKMKGNVKSLKSYLIRTSTEIRNSSLGQFDSIKDRVERIYKLLQAL
ncbi:MAG: hypothetical protein ACFFDQ_00530 [Candidatus Thorarchaeota archaeon]